MAIEQRWTMQSTDILLVGKELGYEWNALGEEVKKEGLHGSDGSGSMRLDKHDLEDLISEPLKTIFRHIFASHPGMEDITIIN